MHTSNNLSFGGALQTLELVQRLLSSLHAKQIVSTCVVGMGATGWGVVVPSGARGSLALEARARVVVGTGRSQVPGADHCAFVCFLESDWQARMPEAGPS